MRSILEQLYNGEVYPAEHILPTDPNYREVNQKAAEEKEHFRKMLLPEETERFDNMIDLIYNSSSMYGYASYSYGFRLGVNLLLEALTNTGDLVRKNNYIHTCR